MNDVDLLQLLLAFATALVAGAINSIAGGGTLLTFPVLFAVLGDAKVANITSTLGLWPASLGGAWGYRRDMERQIRPFAGFFVISFLGGGVGALLLLITDKSTFSVLAPFLILGATALFAMQTRISKWLARRTTPTATEQTAEAEPQRWWPVLLAQIAVAVYGGYFGAGIGILMLALLGFLGLSDIYQMNGLKNLAGLCINGLALTIFVLQDRLGTPIIHWQIAGAMAIGGVLGGYYCVGWAKRVGPGAARRIIIGVGIAGAIYTAVS